MDVLIILLFFITIIHSMLAACPEHVFLTCLLRLKAQRVPMERNMLSVVFSIGTEARLLHTCKVYSSTLPCFREKIIECGDEKQRRLLNDVGKMLMFLCSPFSLQQQRAVIKHQECIHSIIQMPSALQCSLSTFPEGRQVLQCKKNCAEKNSDFICLMRTWISEQNICTLKDINDKCGADAAALYRELQQTVFEPMFPIICEYEISEKTTFVPTSPTPSTPASISLPPRVVTKLLPGEFRRAPTTQQKKQQQLFPTHNMQQARIMNITSPPLIISPSSTATSADNRNVYSVVTRIKNGTKPKRVKSKSKTNKPISSSTIGPVTITVKPILIPISAALTLPPPTLDSDSDAEFQVTEAPKLWTKRPSGTLELNRQIWQQPIHIETSTERYYPFATEHPLFPSTAEEQIPRSHRVIDMLKSLLPENFPERLTSLLGAAGLSQTLANFTQTNSYHTPSIAELQSSVTENPNLRFNSLNFQHTFYPKIMPVMNPNPAYTKIVPTLHSMPRKFNPNPYSYAQESPKKWRPWYLKGTN